MSKLYFIDRIKTEYKEVRDRTDKLHDFICTDTYDRLPFTERLLLEWQYDSMIAYCKVLLLRLEYYENTKQN